MKIKNLTPHIINIHLPDGEVITLPPSGEVARVAAESRDLPAVKMAGDPTCPECGGWGYIYGHLAPEDVPEPGAPCLCHRGVTPLSIPVVESHYGEVKGLPPRVGGVSLIVSRLVLETIKKDRPDVYCPGDLIRDAAGQPVGCKGLAR